MLYHDHAQSLYVEHKLLRCTSCSGTLVCSAKTLKQIYLSMAGKGLSALKGRPRHTAKAAMEDGDGSLRSVMSALDQVYGGATTYTTLLNKLNSVQQGYDETAKDYYERVLQIRVKLQEFHAFMFRNLAT